MVKKKQPTIGPGPGKTARGKRKALTVVRNQGAQAAGMSQAGGRSQEKMAGDRARIRKKSTRQT
ncbi:hypothetical protein [Bacillus licheniformis]|uniref:hypothetical protein n=1 Tax=Bacillus licheniformis TaxID=1402 RepID=UPI000926801C|nr:hypothetical protein [Bacillus licheniformis]OJT66840.1 hypothetical protein BFP46_22545 [Bacillus licheniformis]